MLKSLFILILALLVPYFIIEEPTHAVKTLYSPQNQTKIWSSSSKMLNKDGTLINEGYTQIAIKSFNEQDVTPFYHKVLSFLRVKKWDVFTIFTKDSYIMTAYLDLGYIHNSFTFFYNFTSQEYKSYQTDIFSQKFKLSDESFKFQQNHTRNDPMYSISFQRNLKNQNFDISFKNKEIDLQIQALLPKKLNQIISIAPFNKEKTQFFYAQKGYNIPFSGTLQNQTSSEQKAIKGQIGFDIGRGVWPYKSYWVFGHGMDIENNLGLNLGSGSYSDANHSDDAFFENDIMLKLNTVEPFIHMSNDNMIIFKTSKLVDAGDVDITFRVDKKVQDNVNFLLIRSEMTKFFGYFNGFIINKDGEVQGVHDMPGFVEIGKNRW